VSTDPVRITHPFHPRQGQILDVLACRTQWGEARVFYPDVDGHQASIPVGWTSLAPEDPFVALAAGRARFRCQDMLQLAALIADSGP
jgi:hypothetical protein